MTVGILDAAAWTVLTHAEVRPTDDVADAGIKAASHTLRTLVNRYAHLLHHALVSAPTMPIMPLLMWPSTAVLVACSRPRRLAPSTARSCSGRR